MKTSLHERGIALLITLLIMSVLLGISAFLLSMTLGQFKLSGIARDSEMAFQAAEAGIECAVYTDNTTTPSPFAVPGDGTSQTSPSSMNCFNQTSQISNSSAKSGDPQNFRYEWGTPTVCTDISIYKFFNSSADVDMSSVLGVTGPVYCTTGYECTVIKSRGYNVGCGSITNSRAIEREITQRF